jgi:hypothetical protein
LRPPTAFWTLPSTLSAFAVSRQFGIAYRLADGLLDRAFELFHRSRDPILVHD